VYFHGVAAILRVASELFASWSVFGSSQLVTGGHQMRAIDWSISGRFHTGHQLDDQFASQSFFLVTNVQQMVFEEPRTELAVADAG